MGSHSSTSLFKRWFNVRLGRDIDKRLFKKAHVTSGVKTNIITAVNITEGYAHDSPQFENLIKVTAKNFNVREVSADAAYASRNNFEVVFTIGAIPYIMFKKTDTGRAKGSMAWHRMHRYFQEHKQDFLGHYHQRSNAESVFAMIKRKFNMHLYCKNEAAQVNELLCKCLCHNICVLIAELFECQAIVSFENSEVKIVRGF